MSGDAGSSVPLDVEGQVPKSAHSGPYQVEVIRATTPLRPGWDVPSPGLRVPTERRNPGVCAPQHAPLDGMLLVLDHDETERSTPPHHISRVARYVRQLPGRGVFEDNPRLDVLNLGPGGKLVENEVAQLIGVAHSDVNQKVVLASHVIQRDDG